MGNDQSKQVIAPGGAVTPQLVEQIQGVIDDNQRTEFFLLIGTGVLFTLGAVALLAAVISGNYLWSVPPAFVSALLYWPIKRIERLRNRNIALVVAAALIPTLPPAKAAMEIQKLLEKLFQDEK